jgi:hypothetical protein
LPLSPPRNLRTKMQQYTVPAGTVYRTMVAPRGQRIFTYSLFGVRCADSSVWF